MIGTNLNLVLPSLSDTMATAISKTATALSAIQDSIADKATPAALNINTALALNGNALTEVTSVQLAAGNAPTVAGAIYYASGEFFAIDATGTVQLTKAGAINASGVGGIGGDYGGTNPAAVTYDNASTQYRFTSNVGVWADIVARNVILEGGSGSVQLGVAAITGARQFNFDSLPNSGISLLAYNGSTSNVEDAATVTVSNALTMSGTLTTTTDRKHSDAWEYVIAMVPAVQLTNTGYSGSTYKYITSTDVGTADLQVITGLRVGDRIKSFTFYVTGSGTVSWGLVQVDNSGASLTTVASGVNSVGGDNTFTGGGLPITLLSDKQYYFHLAFSASGGECRSMRITVDHP